MFNDLLVKHNLKVRFVLVGIWNTIFGYAVFFILDSIFLYVFTTRYIAYMFAIILGRNIAIINAYIFHRLITFRSRTKGKEIIKEFSRFYMTYTFNFILSIILLPLFVEVFNINPKIAGAIIIPFCAVMSYLGHSRFSFKQQVS